MAHHRPIPRRPEFQIGDDLHHYIKALGDLWDMTPQIAAEWLGLTTFYKSWLSQRPLNGLVGNITDDEQSDAARAMGIDPGDLALSTVGGYQRTQLVFGVDLRDDASPLSEVLYTDVSPACLACLAERPLAMRFAWRFPLLPVCLAHGAILNDACPSCGSALLLSRSATRSGLCHCGYRYRSADAIPMGDIPGLGDAAQAISNEIVAQLDHRSPMHHRLDLTATGHILGLISGLETCGLRAVPRQVSTRDLASHLPLAVQLATVPPSHLGTALDAFPRLGDVSWRMVYPLWGPATGRVRVLVAARAARDGWIDPLPGDVTRAEARSDREQWPQLLPTDIYTVELADLLHDALAHATRTTPDWSEGRMVAAVLTAAWNLSTTYEAAALHIGLTAENGHLAAQAARAAEQLGTAETLSQAVLHAARATGRWKDWQRFTRRDPRDHAARLGIPEQDYSRWLQEEHHCRRNPTIAPLPTAAV